MQTGESESGTETIVQDTSPVDSEIDTDIEALDDNKNETAHETVLRAYDALKNTDSTDENNDSTKEPAGNTNQDKEKPKQENQTPHQIAEEIRPPDRLNAKQKEAFNKAPPEVKTAIKQMFKDYQSQFTSANMQIQRAAKESQGVSEIIRSKIPEWRLQGYTAPQVVEELIAGHELLVQNPEKAILFLAHQQKVDLKKLAGFGSGQEQEGAAPSGDITNHPQYKALEAKIDGLTSRLDPIQNHFKGYQDTQVQQSGEKIANEIRQLQNQQDATGKYFYPELHDSGFIAGLKTWLLRSREDFPNDSWGDLTRRAIAAHRAIPSNNSFENLPGTAAQLPNPDRQNEVARAKAANVSTRGRGSALGSGLAMPEKIPDSVKDTVLMAHRMLANR